MTDESTLDMSGDSELDAIAARIAALDSGEDGSESDELSEEPAVTGNKEPDDSGQEGEPSSGESEEESPDDEAESEEKADADEEQEPPVSSLDDLIQALEVDPSTLMSLKAKVKIDGEDGEATLADLIKSYQVEGHLTRRSQKLAEDRQLLERGRQELEAQAKQRLEQLDTHLALAQRKLMGEYGTIDWDTLRAQNPHLYQQKYIEYQQINGELAQLAQGLAQERQRQQQSMVERHKEYLAEQKRLLANAVPEWNDRKVKDSELNEIREYMKSRNIDPKELDLVQNHGYALVLRDAKNWQKLQAEKKAIKPKLKGAKPILKPGFRKPASQISRDKLKTLRERVSKSGSVDDVAAFILATDN